MKKVCAGILVFAGLAVAGLLLLRGRDPEVVVPSGGPVADWPAYGRDPGGSRYSPVAQINRENVKHLGAARTYTLRDLAPVPLALRYGTPSMGGPVVTAGGLVFIGVAMDNYLRPFDVETGEELWKERLPAGGQATPMTYPLSENGKQHLVIAADGHGKMGTGLGDYVAAFTLP